MVYSDVTFKLLEEYAILMEIHRWDSFSISWQEYSVSKSRVNLMCRAVFGLSSLMSPRGRSSVQPIPPLNSSYSCLSFRSVVLSILCKTTVQTSFDRTEIYPTEIQLSELWRSPFSGSFTMMPMFQSSGWVSCSQTLKCQGQTAGMESVSHFSWFWWKA